MRIVHVIDYFQPKLGYQETFLAREHSKSGHDVYVVTSDRYNPIVYAGNAARPILGDRIVGPGFSVEEGVKVWRLPTLFEVPHAIWMLGLKKKLRELKPELVIVHGIANFSAIIVASLKNKSGDFRLIYDDHMTFDNSTSPLRILYPLFKWLFSPLIQKAADALVAILPETRSFMHKRYGIPTERIAVIPLGADDELFRFDAEARKEMRGQLNLSEDDVLFLYTGKIVPQKRLHILINAAGLMKDWGMVKLLLVGSGDKSYIEQLKGDIKAKDIESKFAWHEAVPNNELYRIYSAADVAVWPYEASISMREAMACGLPIIIGEASKVTELVEYDNGLLYREEDAADLAQKMERLLDRQLRREMGARSRKLIEDRLNWRVIARRFIELVSGQKI